MDDDNNKTLSLAEFGKGLRDYGVPLEKPDIKKMFDAFDEDGSGNIDFDEFLIKLRVSSWDLCHQLRIDFRISFCIKLANRMRELMTKIN